VREISLIEGFRAIIAEGEISLIEGFRGRQVWIQHIMNSI